MEKFKRFLTISKIDEEKRMVYGFATTPDLDSDNEIISLEAVKKALPAYMQFPTLREMHQAKAAGTVKQADMIEGQAKNGLYIGAKVVADDSWKMVKEGVYKAFSIGGNVLKKIGNIIEEIELIEISLVDVPANKAAKIDLWKAGGKTKPHFQKDTCDGTTLAAMADNLKWLIDKETFENDDKTVPQLKLALDALKQAAIYELQEPDTDDVDSYPVLMMAATLEERAESISKLDLGNNKLANQIREGVVIAMKDKAKELSKTDSVKPEDKEETKVDETTATTDDKTTVTEDKKEDTTEDVEVKTETTTEEVKTEATEEKEAKADVTLVKLSSIDKKLEQIAPVAKAEIAKLSLEKTVKAMASTIEKMADIISTQEARIVKLENTPAALKSKSVAVVKTILGDEENTPKVDVKPATGELAIKEARLKELEKIFDEKGRDKFAGALSIEASKLQDEIAELKRKAK